MHHQLRCRIATTLLAGTLALHVAGHAAETDGAEIAGGDLLTTIVSAQQAVERVSGKLRQATAPVDEPEAEPNAYHVRFHFALPDKYYLEYSPVDDPEEIEWFISDGEQRVHAEQLFAGQDPIVSRKPVDPGAWGFQRVADFFRMDLEALRRDFDVQARQPTDDEAGRGAAVVELTPKVGRLQEDLRGITVFLDADHRTREVVILDQQDNRIRITVEQAEYDAEIPADTFVWPEE